MWPVGRRCAKITHCPLTERDDATGQLGRCVDWALPPEHPDVLAAGTTFTATAIGVTQMIDIVEFQSPLGPLGTVADRLVFDHDLPHLLRQRNIWLPGQARVTIPHARKPVVMGHYRVRVL